MMERITYSKYGKLYKGLSAIQLISTDLKLGAKIYKMIEGKKEYYHGDIRYLSNYMNPYIFEETKKRFSVKLNIEVTDKTPLQAMHKVLNYIKEDYIDYVEVEHIKDLETKVYYGPDL